MAPPVAVYVVATIVGIGAVLAFKEYVYEPHLAPKLEAWAEDFLQRRRAARNRRASAVSVRASRRRRDSASSSDPSDPNGDHQRQVNQSDRAPEPNNPVDELELEALVSREVDEWRNEVLRSQERTTNSLRKRRTSRLVDDSDGFDAMSTTLDESFTSLSHTPLASTHVISNVSSPMTPSTVSLPLSPTRRLRSESQSTATQGDVASPGSIGSTPRRPTNAMANPDVVFPSPLAIPNPARRSSATDGAPQPLPYTPTQAMAEESPFGPLLPDTPRSSAEIYGERPFSPITRVMAPSSGHVSAAGSMGAIPSRTNSTSSLRPLGSSGMLRKSSGLANEVKMDGSDDGSDSEEHPHVSMSTSTLPSSGANQSTIGSLSERYPAPPTPPVMVSPPTSSIGMISAPSSPRSGGSEVVVHEETVLTASHLPTSLPLLQLPTDSSGPGLISRSRSSGLSPAISDASFLSPIPFSRTASESEADEFLSIASDDSEWGMSPVAPSCHTAGPVHDREHNPFLDFEHLTRDTRGNSDHGDGSEGSEVLIGHEGGSEVGSEESWGSARRH